MVAEQIYSIYAEMTPNPMAMKFVADRLLLPDGVQLEFLNAKDAGRSPVAEKLFELPFVKGVFIMANFITVLKNDKAYWDDVVFEVRDYIKNFLQQGGEVISRLESKEITGSEEMKEGSAIANNPLSIIAHTIPANETEHKIVETLEQYVKPAVENDGGMIVFRSFKDGIVALMLKGSCSGCPSSTLTLKSAVENMLTSMVPGVKEVIQEME
jgi:Fe-S cluster biogenesis protein NfuA